MSNWKPVSSFISFTTKGITPNYVDKSSIIVLNQKCIRNNKIDYSFAQFTDDSKDISETKFVRNGDIIMNSTGTGTAGRCAFVSELPINYRLIVDSHILILRCDSFNASQCLSYLLYSFEKKLMSFMTGSSGQSELDKVVLLSLKTKMPNDSIIQQKIASVLYTLDSKIELNSRINTELEAMAKTLYDYWFVQFDFPDKNGKPYKSSGGKMLWNEELKREIPKGWEVAKMADWIDSDKSGDWGKEESEGNFTKKVTCIRGADIKGLNGLAELKPPVRYILEKNSSKILNSHDLIIEISGGSPVQSTGRIAFITDATIKRFENPLICSNFCKPISIKNKKLLYNFVYYWNSLYDAGIFFGYEGKTSGIKNLLFDSFVSSFYTVVPDDKIVDQFYNIMGNIQEKKQNALAENQQLAELRDWLLPMLMNGQVKVCEETEQILNMVAEPEQRYKKG
jgi:type I restriction enzyme S subunit